MAFTVLSLFFPGFKNKYVLKHLYTLVLAYHNGVYIHRTKHRAIGMVRHRSF